MVAAVDAPINADFESGFASDAAGVAESVRLAAETGIAGLSIEDSAGNPAHPLLTLDDAIARMRAARQAIDKAGGDVLLLGRAECFLVGRPDMTETIARLQAYANAGADCLYAPGVSTRVQISALVQAVAPKPFNLLVGSASPLTVADIAALGVRHISVGGAMARSAWVASCARPRCWQSTASLTGLRMRLQTGNSICCSNEIAKFKQIATYIEANYVYSTMATARFDLHIAKTSGTGRHSRQNGPRPECHRQCTACRACISGAGLFQQPQPAVCRRHVSRVSGRAAERAPRTGVCADWGRDMGVITQGIKQGSPGVQYAYTPCIHPSDFFWKLTLKCNAPKFTSPSPIGAILRCMHAHAAPPKAR